jgi:hypothetical protein
MKGVAAMPASQIKGRRFVPRRREARKAPKEPITVHTSVFCRDLTAAVVRALKRCGATQVEGHIQSPFFCELVVKEVADHIDWEEVRRRMR